MRVMKQLMLLAILLASATTAAAGEITYAYDSVNRLISATHGTTGSVATFYFDAAHNLKREGRILDSDEDGLPDAWEIEHFGSITVSDGSSSADQDEDGLSDMEEYLTGTDPDNAASGLRGGMPSPTPGTNTITWTSAANRTYEIDYSTNLLDTSAGFSLLASGIDATPTTNTYTHVTTNSPSFYRVRAIVEGGE